MRRLATTGWCVVVAAAAFAGQVPGDRAAVPAAFPGAEGFGAATRGGRGGAVLFVDNLNDSGPGSLRAAVEAKGPRTVLFRVSGTIRLQKKLAIREPNITIAGQSAPGDGICLAGYQLDIQTDEVIVRHLRVRPGNENQGERDAITIRNAHNVIIDHCSASWGLDELVSATQSSNVTVQWCIIAEALHNAGHHKGNHGYGSLIRGEGISYHHNLYAHNRSRNPRVGEGRIDFNNNVVYNWDGMAAYAGDERHELNFADNYFKPGPSTDSNPQLAYHTGGPENRLYFAGNLLETADGQRLLNDAILQQRDGVMRVDEPFESPLRGHVSAEVAYTRVLARAGAVLPRRDAADRRVVGSVGQRSGAHLDSPDEVGGWPELGSQPPASDADEDGMPDHWENQYRLNPKDSRDGAADQDGDGYTNLEEFLNATRPDEPDLE